MSIFAQHPQKVFSRPVIGSIIVWLAWWVAATPCLAQRDIYQALPGLDDRFQAFSNQYYRILAKKQSGSHFETMDALSKYVHARVDVQPVDATAAIVRHKDLLQRSYRSTAFGKVLKVLYNHNETATIRDITNFLNKSGNRLGKSTNYFLLGRYYSERENWKGVRAALSHVDVKHLQDGDNDYFYMLRGFALQGVKKHREALDEYKHVPKDSPYFQHAKLNLGTALLRQGWWTDAHMEFTEAIEHKSPVKDEEFNNRMLVVLGYSQLHHQFYRDANKTFSKVALDSLFVNKALMGMGLAAAYQNDFPTANNIFTILAEKTPRDLNADEANILLPFTFEELNNTDAAAEAYSKAADYFQARLKEVDAAKMQLAAARGQDIAPTLKTLEAQAAELYGASNLIPGYFLDNYILLMAMQDQSSALGLQKETSALISDYELTLKKLVNQNLIRRQEILNSYLSQAKFGVAKLYDK